MGVSKLLNRIEYFRNESPMVAASLYGGSMYTAGSPAIMGMFNL